MTRARVQQTIEDMRSAVAAARRRRLPIALQRLSHWADALQAALDEEGPLAPPPDAPRLPFGITDTKERDPWG